MDPELISQAPLWYLAFLLSVTCHEAAHAWAAQRLGDDTAARGGQVTLNPIPHIQRAPFGMVVVPLVSLFLGGWMIGWASAPYDPYWQQRYPRRAAWMAIAGPAANFLLVILAALVMLGGIIGGAFTLPTEFFWLDIVSPATPMASGFATFLSILFVENVLLGAFNLIPVPPLDGATAIGLFLPESVALSFVNFMRQPGFSLMGLVIAWRAFDYVFPPVYSFALQAFHLSVAIFT